MKHGFLAPQHLTATQPQDFLNAHHTHHDSRQRLVLSTTHRSYPVQRHPRLHRTRPKSIRPAPCSDAKYLFAPEHAAPHELADMYLQFCKDVIDVVAPLVPIVKPQLAYFEALGPHGTTALAEVIAYAHKKELLVLADGKRGDIGSTAEAYAAGWLAGPWAADALTVNPYLGLDSIEPFIKRATTNNAGIFVLVKTSNPGGKDFQDLKVDQSHVYDHVAKGVEAAAIQNSR